MKKIFCVLLYLPLIFSSCKEEEEVILANDIIVGDWIIYHKEVTGSDSNLSFAENYDLETISLSVNLIILGLFLMMALNQNIPGMD